MRPVTNTWENSILLSLRVSTAVEEKIASKFGALSFFSSDDVTSHLCRHLYEEENS